MSESSEDLTQSKFLLKSSGELNLSCDGDVCEYKGDIDLSPDLLSNSTTNPSQKIARSSPDILSSSEKIAHSGFVKREKNGTLHDGQFETGQLFVTYGSMKAGKSTSSIGYANRMSNLGLDVCYVLSNIDTRTDKQVKSHHDDGKVSLSEKIPIIRTDFLSSVYSELLKYTVIVIDEGQFFSDIIQVENLVLREKKQVYISALDCDAALNKFGKVHEVIHLCAPGNLNKIAALCVDCAAYDHRFQNAGFTYCLKNNTINEGNQIHVGADEYIALCLKHHQQRTSAK